MIQQLLKIPPFQDAHMHFMQEGHPANLSDLPSLSKAYLSKGILSLQDMGHKSGLGLECKKTNRENCGFLDIRSAGFALYKKGTYGGFLGKGVSGKKEIEVAVRSLAEAGADFIKVINSGIVSLQEKNPVTEGGFSSEEWKVIQEEAERVHLKIHCHANSDQSIQQAVDFGVSSIEHGFFISEETLWRMLEKSVFWTPTVTALFTLQSMIPQEAQRTLHKIIEDHLRSIYFSASIGVKLQVGTDSGSKGVKPGSAFIKELRLYQKAGLSFSQICSAACLNREKVERGHYLLVGKDFIDHGKPDKVFINGIEVTADSQNQSMP